MSVACRGSTHRGLQAAVPDGLYEPNNNPATADRSGRPRPVVHTAAAPTRKNEKVRSHAELLHNKHSAERVSRLD